MISIYSNHPCREEEFICEQSITRIHKEGKRAKLHEESEDATAKVPLN